MLQVDTDQASTRQYHVGPLLTYVKYYVTKAAVVESAVQFLLFLVVLAAALFSLGDVGKETATAATLSTRLLDKPSFDAAANRRDVAAWLKDAVPNFHDTVAAAAMATTNTSSTTTTSGNPNSAVSGDVYPVGGTWLALFAVDPEPCDKGGDDGMTAFLRSIDPSFDAAALCDPVGFPPSAAASRGPALPENATTANALVSLPAWGVFNAFPPMLQSPLDFAETCGAVTTANVTSPLPESSPCRVVLPNASQSIIEGVIGNDSHVSFPFIRVPRGELCSGGAATGDRDEYDWCRAAVNLFIPFGADTALLRQALAVLAGDASSSSSTSSTSSSPPWILQNARAVSVRSTIFHDGVGVFIAPTFVAEFGDGSGVHTTVTQRAFRVLSTGSGASVGAHIALDCLLLLCLVAAVVFGIYRASLFVEVNSRIANAFDLSWVLDVAVVAAVAVLLGFRAFAYVTAARDFPCTLFSNGDSDMSGELPLSINTVQGDGPVMALNASSVALWAQEAVCSDRLHFQALWAARVTLAGAFALLCVVFRFAFSLGRMSRFSLVSETIAAAATDLFSITLITAVVLFAYTLVGCVYFGSTDTPFRSIGRGLCVLFNVMVSLNVDFYTDYEAVDAVATLFFFLSFFIISWCVLMNILVGVLATAFAAAAMTQTLVRRPLWSPAAVSHDVRRFAHRVRRWETETEKDGVDGQLAAPRDDPLNEARDMAVEPGPSSIPHDAVAAVPEIETNRVLGLFRWFIPPTLVRALALLKALRGFKSQGGNTTGLTLDTVAGVSTFSRAETARMLAKAELHVGISDANRRRWLVMQKLIRTDKDVSAQLSKQYRELQELMEAVCGNDLGAEGSGDDSDSDDESARSVDSLAGPESAASRRAQAAAQIAERAAQGLKSPEGGLQSSVMEGSFGSNPNASFSRRKSRAHRLRGLLASTRTVAADVHDTQLRGRLRTEAVAAMNECGIDALLERYERIAAHLGVVVPAEEATPNTAATPTAATRRREHETAPRPLFRSTEDDDDEE